MGFKSSHKGIIASLLVLGAIAGLFVALQFALFCFTPANSGAKAPIVIEIHKGQAVREVIMALVNAGVIADGQKISWLGRLTRQWKKMKAGEYQVSAGMTPIEVLAVITSGVSINHPITVREGENIFELARALAEKKLANQDKFMSLCQDNKFIATLGLQQPLPPSLEGYLFPDTYFLNRSLSAEEMIQQMVKRFTGFWGQANEDRARAIGLTRHQVITLASMIEKETGAASERAMISSVFHNRLRKRMRLQSDPTTVYGIWERFDGNIRRSDLETKTPYNTYMIPGLPVGPIGNPGKEAIQAALYPLATDYLFFVSHNDGTHEFTRTFEEHGQAVRRFQLDPHAREGKSWRDLGRKKEN